ncbi:MAG: phenylacetate-CoA oxygenase subunit PaaJ [Anaerolineales bacterium]|nr:phenylacetate-CoA oxygenase subunit PaaJ [Anaerolineales bacterium]MCB0014129.1 phenylacetate-CoA oxygenase subunit PaaJ [Anaerolineales bacterium]
MSLTEAAAWKILEDVTDPEIPVVSLIEMGIIRAVRVDGEQITVKMTPTFSGCPALTVMIEDIERALRAAGAPAVEVKTVLSPPWSSDWITESGRAKLKAFGLAPPPQHGGNMVVTFFEPVACPRCDSTHTTIRNSFGPTLCRAIYYCEDCQEPFEQFKPI